MRVTGDGTGRSEAMAGDEGFVSAGDADATGGTVDEIRGAATGGAGDDAPEGGGGVDRDGEDASGGDEGGTTWPGPDGAVSRGVAIGALAVLAGVRRASGSDA